MSENELFHYGVKGMEWGKHKFGGREKNVTGQAKEGWDKRREALTTETRAAGGPIDQGQAGTMWGRGNYRPKLSNIPDSELQKFTPEEIAKIKGNEMLMTLVSNLSHPITAAKDGDPGGFHAIGSAAGEFNDAVRDVGLNMLDKLLKKLDK